MRQLISLALLLSILILGVPVSSQSIEEASEAYKRGEYETAILIYEFLLLDNPQDGIANANLGHAYYMTGEIGRALQHYLRAKQSLSRNTVIDQQIKQIQRERLDGLSVETDWLNNAHRLTANYLTVSELGIIVFVLWCVFFAGLVLPKRDRRLLVPVLGVLMLAGVILLSARIYVDANRPQAVILDPLVQVESGPGESFLDLFVLYEGIDLKVLDSRDEWVRVMLADGRQGWIRATSLGYIPNGLG